MITFPRGREVVLGVGAGIAAYKSCDLLRRLQDHGYQVTVIPTPSSLNFVGKTTWEALSGRAVNTQLWETGIGVSHVEIAGRADLIVVAPATADLIARIAAGRADDLLTTTILASNAPILVVPAMHPAMWLNAATVANVETLRARGMTVVEPDVGRLTGSDSGVGRFPETSRIIQSVNQISGRSGKLIGRKIVVTAGGTVESIDPVRFLGNRSSGRQGLAIAYEALCEGAQISVVAAATEEFELPGAEILEARSAAQMLATLREILPASDALVMCAAVADARPVVNASEKISKEALEKIELTQNPDILAELAASKRAEQIFVGFAAETQGDLIDRGRRKLHRKGVDLLYVTDVAGGAVFGESKTSGSLISKRGEELHFDRVDKHEVARAIVAAISNELGAERG